MSENENCEKKGVCFGPNFRSFISVTAGTFFGVFFALNLFSVVHLPYLDKMHPSKPVPHHIQMQKFHHPMPAMEQDMDEAQPEYKHAQE